MTTIAYAAVTQSGLSFDRQLWMRPEIIPGLREITDAVHKEGAAVSIQLGHCGNMSHKSICGVTPIGASSGFNLYSPTFVRGLRKEELPQMAKAYGQSVNWAREAGFDAVEIHAGHGYLISQFLSPYTNHRKDEFGGSLENRMRFMDMVMEEVMRAAGNDMAVLVKTNMRDGFKGGMEIDEAVQVAKRLVQDGAHALVLSGGFVSKAPMYVMRGAMPIKSMTHYMNCWWLKYGVRMVGTSYDPDHVYDPPNPECDAKISSLLSQLYSLESSARSAVSSAISAAKDEYHSLPAEERTFANKVSIAYKHLSSVESTYDSAVSSVVSEMRRVLREYNQPETVADQAWSYYQSAKSSMISSLGG